MLHASELPKKFLKNFIEGMITALSVSELRDLGVAMATQVTMPGSKRYTLHISTVCAMLFLFVTIVTIVIK